MKNFIIIFFVSFLVSSCETISEKKNILSKKKKITTQINQEINNFKIQVNLSQVRKTVCEIKFTATNNNSSKKDLYVEVQAFNRKNINIGTFNYVLSDILPSQSAEKKDYFVKTKFCFLVKNMKIYGG